MDKDETAMDRMDMTALHPVLPQRLDWPSMIGLFILNFGVLELALSHILKLRSKPESKNAAAKKSFHEKIRCLQALVDWHPEMVQKRERWQQLVLKMDAIRDLRNHLSHGMLVHTVAEDLKGMSQVLCLTQEVSADKPDVLKVTFQELVHQNQVLSGVIDELAALDYVCEGAHKPFDGMTSGDGMWTHVPLGASGAGHNARLGG